MTPASISRRGVIAAPIVLAGCRERSDYFGNAAPPPRRVLKFALGPEPTTLDPGNYAGDFEVYILPSVFEGLTSHDPQTVEPTAGLATHYETNSDDTRIQFFLRGHPNPRGTPLPGGDRTTPARWTDGAVITAHDFVYSWRRIIDPATAAPYAYMLYGLRNARDIQRGTKRAHQLGVSAPDDFTFNVEFDRPSPLFLKLTGSIPLSAVPRQAIEAAERRGRPADWIEPENMVSSGAFRLKEWRPHERVILERNRHYYDADMVSLDEIHFLSVARPGTIVNLYQSGEAHSMPGERLPAQFASVLEGRHDFHVAPAVFGVWSVMNTTRPPCDDPLVRYAINMAIDKQRFASVFGSGRTPAKTFVPPMPGYPVPEEVNVEIGGRKYNVLEHNPEAAKALLALSRYGSGKALRLKYMLNAELPLSPMMGPLFRKQLADNLNVDLTIDVQDYKTWEQMQNELTYEGLSDGGDWGPYVDPEWFLHKYVSGSRVTGTGFADARFDQILTEANSILDPVARMSGLAECERYVLRSMPLVPLCYNTWSYLQKPFVRGLPPNLLDLRLFKYASIDTRWRPQ